MATIIFVHGIGGRLDNYDDSFKSIQEQVKRESESRKLKTPSVVPCIWGDSKGANPQGLSRPEQETTEDPKMEEKDLLWQKLYEDPLWEIRRLGYRAKQSQDPGSLMGKSNKDKLKEKIKSIEMKVEEESAKNELIRLGLKDIIQDAYQQVIKSQAYERLLDTVGASQQAESTAIARVIVAVSIQLLKNQGRSSAIIYNANLRDEAINYLDTQIMPNQEMGLLPKEIKETLQEIWQEKLTKGVKNIGLPMLTDYLQNSPQMLTNKIDVSAGDILIYQTTYGGQGIRQKIKETIDDYSDEETVILLAHSLGGVACVDLLIEQEIKNVKLLITVGSQAPFFHEIGALQSLQPKPEKPEKSFPQGRFKWLNIYDVKDFLSFIGRNIFPGCVEDKQVDNQQPFPISHLAYWENGEMWQVIFDYLEEHQLV